MRCNRDKGYKNVIVCLHNIWMYYRLSVGSLMHLMMFGFVRMNSIVRADSFQSMLCLLYAVTLYAIDFRLSLLRKWHFFRYYEFYLNL